MRKKREEKGAREEKEGKFAHFIESSGSGPPWVKNEA